MENTTKAELELPTQHIAAAFEISEEELEAAMMSGMVKVEQEAVSPDKDGELPSSVKLTLTFADKVVSMPVALNYPDLEESALG
jgi:hypothetical protein